MAETVVDQLVTFEVQLTAVDYPTDRRRWSGGPLASLEAHEALNDAVDAFSASVCAAGFDLVHTGYGVTARPR